MSKLTKSRKYIRRPRRGVVYVAKKFNLVHSCGGCVLEQDDVCTLHENIPAFEDKASGVSQKYFHICEDWEDKTNMDNIMRSILGCKEDFPEDYSYD